VRRHGIGPNMDIPQLSAEFIRKFLGDLVHLQLV
jgi:hypothetical protein